MIEDLNSFKKKIENKNNKINELEEELKQLTKNIEANNRIFMNKSQNNSKPTKKNMFLFHGSQKGYYINKKQEIINYKKNFKSYEIKKAKSTPKTGGFININKNNVCLTNNARKNSYFNFYRNYHLKTLDSKNNLNNIKSIKKNNNNIMLIKTNNEISQESDTTNNIQKREKKSKYLKTEPNFSIKIIHNFNNNYYCNLNDKIKNNNNIVNSCINNISSKIIFNNSKINTKMKDFLNQDLPTKIKADFFYEYEKDKSKGNTIDKYKHLEEHIDSVFGQYFSYYNKTINVSNVK